MQLPGDRTVKTTPGGRRPVLHNPPTGSRMCLCWIATSGATSELHVRTDVFPGPGSFQLWSRYFCMERPGYLHLFLESERERLGVVPSRCSVGCPRDYRPRPTITRILETTYNSSRYVLQTLDYFLYVSSKGWLEGYPLNPHIAPWTSSPPVPSLHGHLHVPYLRSAVWRQRRQGRGHNDRNVPRCELLNGYLDHRNTNIDIQPRQPRAISSRLLKNALQFSCSMLQSAAQNGFPGHFLSCLCPRCF